MAGDLLSVLLPEALPHVRYVLRRHRGKTIALGPLLGSKFQFGKVVFLGGKNVVQPRAFSYDSKVGWKYVMKVGPRQDPMWVRRLRAAFLNLDQCW